MTARQRTVLAPLCWKLLDHQHPRLAVALEIFLCGEIRFSPHARSRTPLSSGSTESGSVSRLQLSVGGQFISRCPYGTQSTDDQRRISGRAYEVDRGGLGSTTGIHTDL